VSYVNATLQAGERVTAFARLCDQERITGREAQNIIEQYHKLYRRKHGVDLDKLAETLPSDFPDNPEAAPPVPRGIDILDWHFDADMRRWTKARRQERVLQYIHELVTYPKGQMNFSVHIFFTPDDDKTQHDHIAEIEEKIGSRCTYCHEDWINECNPEKGDGYTAIFDFETRRQADAARNKLEFGAINAMILYNYVTEEAE
jgi:hypothetical protein